MVPTGSPDIFLNGTLTSEPTIEGDYLSLPFDGTFFVQDLQNEPVEYTEMPIHNKDGKSVQIYLSQKSLNSALIAFHEQNELKFTQPISYSVVQQLFPNFGEVFGQEYDGVPLQIYSFDKAPNVQIKHNQTMFEGNMGLRIMNPLNNSLEAASMELKFNATINMTIGHDFEFKGAVWIS